MDDPELEAIRQARIRELQAAAAGGGSKSSEDDGEKKRRRRSSNSNGAVWSIAWKSKRIAADRSFATNQPTAKAREKNCGTFLI
ncbi:3259_t:CDS:2 [Racocetra fulgida]|uniref:3259_t:CDS:1 n=1 Tax=Racocetra fulgida TaxID=60492 RepID=A0A9N9BRV2_9GLOM|nr:3259_t:CDS:2 [Racocetra fulgida]